MSDKFLKLVKSEAARRVKAERDALEFNIKAGKRQLLKGIVNFAAAVIDADPADFVNEDSRPIPIKDLPESMRRLCDTQIGEDGIVYAISPSLSAKLNYSRLGMMGIEAAREEGVNVSAGENEEDELTQPFVVNITPAEKSDGTLLIEKHTKGKEE